MSLFFGNCECGRKVTNRKYVIENNTNHKIKIDFYQYNRFKLFKEKIGKGVIHEGMSNDGTGKMIAAFFAFRTDSLVIVFNDNKRQIYYMDPIFKSLPVSKRNILNDSSYTHESNKLYRYSFTEEDYNNAEDL